MTNYRPPINAADLRRSSMKLISQALAVTANTISNGLYGIE
jgi:hypothetical protein